MKASELVKQLVDAIAADGDREVALNTGGVHSVGEVISDSWMIYVRSEAIATAIAEDQRDGLLRTEEFRRGRPGAIG